MLMRKLGRTGMKVAALCLGGNTFGWTTDQKASEAVLDAYLEAGGNFIDTADVYSRWAPGNKGGESETALGIWMAARKNRHAVHHGHQGLRPDGPGPERQRPLAPAHHGGGRGLAAPAPDRLHRSLPGALGRPRHAARGDAARLRRPRAPGQGPLHRRLQLRRRGGSPARCGRASAQRLRALRVPPAQVQPGVPRRVRARAGAALPRAGRRRDPLLLARPAASSPASTGRGARRCPRPRAPAGCRRPT